MLYLSEDKKLKNLFKLDPVIRFPDNSKVGKIIARNTDNMTYEELTDLHITLKKSLEKIPISPYKIITIGKKGYLNYPHLKSPIKNEFLRKMEKYINSTWNIRHRERFFVYPDWIDERALFGELVNTDTPLMNPVDSMELTKELAYFFNGTPDYPFGETLEEWEYGFKVGNKYAVALIQYRLPSEVIKFANDYLNHITADFIHVLHFEPMDTMKQERKVEFAVKIAEKTHLPPEVVIELRELQNKITLKEANILSFCQTLFLFGDSKEEVLKEAQRIKSKAPYYLAFEGDIEFEMPFIMTDWDFLKSKDLAGIIRYSTLDYLTSLFPVTKRFTGKPEGYFIPMLNEALEPAYIPINRDLFNAGKVGQMGGGKSVTMQYTSTMFDMSVFIEKIQSDVGSYAVYCNYFDGDYVPLSLEVPVSINPLGKAYSYFTVSIFSLLKEHTSVKTPHKYFDENERGAITNLLDDYIFENKKETLSKEELINITSLDEKTVRFKDIFNDLPERFEWKVKFDVNASRKVFINTILSFMYKGIDEKVDSETTALIERMVDEFYKNRFKENPYQELLISDLYEYIQDNVEESEIKKRLLNRLYSFKQGGKYGHLFDQPTNIDENVENIFFEVRFNEQELIPIAVMTIIDYVNRIYGSFKYRDKTKLVVIDEGWFFLANEMAKDFIDEAFRTYRKRGISIDFGTQRPVDFKTMLNYLPYIFILYLENPREAVEVFDDFTERDYELLKTIDKPKAYGYKYSKMFIRFKNELGKTEKGLFILPSYPEFRWIAETDPVFKLKREKAVRETGNLRKAIEKLSFES